MIAIRLDGPTHHLHACYVHPMESCLAPRVTCRALNGDLLSCDLYRRVGERFPHERHPAVLGECRGLHRFRPDTSPRRRHQESDCEALQPVHKGTQRIRYHEVSAQAFHSNGYRKRCRSSSRRNKGALLGSRELVRENAACWSSQAESKGKRHRATTAPREDQRSIGRGVP